MPNYDELHAAFLAYRRANDLAAANKLIKTVGKADSLSSVAEENWPALIDAFTKGNPSGEQKESAEQEKRADTQQPKRSNLSIGQIHEKLDQMRAGVFRKWNTRSRRD